MHSAPVVDQTHARHDHAADEDDGHGGVGQGKTEPACQKQTTGRGQYDPKASASRGWGRVRTTFVRNVDQPQRNGKPPDKGADAERRRGDRRG